MSYIFFDCSFSLSNIISLFYLMLGTFAYITVTWEELLEMGLPSMGPCCFLYRSKVSSFIYATCLHHQPIRAETYLGFLCFAPCCGKQETELPELSHYVFQDHFFLFVKCFMLKSTYLVLFPHIDFWFRLIYFIIFPFLFLKEKKDSSFWHDCWICWGLQLIIAFRVTVV